MGRDITLMIPVMQFVCTRLFYKLSTWFWYITDIRQGKYLEYILVCSKLTTDVFVDPSLAEKQANTKKEKKKNVTSIKSTSHDSGVFATSTQTKKHQHRQKKKMIISNSWQPISWVHFFLSLFLSMCSTQPRKNTWGDERPALVSRCLPLLVRKRSHFVSLFLPALLSVQRCSSVCQKQWLLWNPAVAVASA